MTSPFPGMDPYLEMYWRDVHTKLIAYASDELNQSLPNDLTARAEERTTIEAEWDDGTENVSRAVTPDIAVFGAFQDLAAVEAAGGGVALAPIGFSVLEEPYVERFIQILDLRGGERVITVIEFISPTNKGVGAEAFIQKRRELMEGGVNIVEIDLVREGNWRRLLNTKPNSLVEATYRAVMRRASTPLRGYLHPFPLREPLPAIKIPLRKAETPCELSLQPLIDRAYRNGRYGRSIDYAQPCEPPLQGDEAAWADELLRKAGRR